MPYLSIVVAARNDQYGGDFLGRMDRFLNVLFGIGRRLRLDAELIVVEWNPPPNRPRLSSAIEWERYRRRFPVRIIEVPAEVHTRFENSDVMPIHEYIAKNTGVRRSQGQFVLSTNPDLLYSKPLLRFLAELNLSETSFYRVDRLDIREPLPSGSPEKQLRFCARHVWRVNTRGTSVVLDPQIAHASRWRRPHPVQVAPKPLDPTASAASRYHTNAAGDFLLMHRERWEQLHGYPEFPTSGHTDGYLCIAAAASGLTEVALPTELCVYHQEHDRAIDWWDTSTATRPITRLEIFEQDAHEMLTRRQPKLVNDANWGLGDVSLIETGVDPR